MINDISESHRSAPHLLEGKKGWQGSVSTCMTHPPVTQPGPADGRPFGKHHKRATTLQSHPQGRSILENLDLMPAFANRARRRAIVLRKHPSGKFHLIITGNCGIRLESRAQNNRGLLGECYFAGDCRSHTVGLSRLKSHLHFLRGPHTSLRPSELVSIPVPGALRSTRFCYSSSFMLCLLHQTLNGRSHMVD